MDEGELDTRVDSLGNLFGRLEGECKGTVLLSGSYLDSVAAGGTLDGAYVVTAALEAAETIRESGCRLRHSYKVVGFNSEQGSDLGGRTFCGLIDCPPAPALLAKYGLKAKDIAAVRKGLA